MKNLPIKDLKIDGGTQPRSEIDESVVAEYAAAMADGAEFPPVVVFHDGASYWLADGFHRTHAARRATIKTIQAEIHNGTKRDAILYSVGANSAHGLRRTPADKRKAVLTLLNDIHTPCERGNHVPKCKCWEAWSNREIARHCNVHNTTVGEHRNILLESSSTKSKSRTFTHHKTGQPSTMNTENIGKGSNKQAAPDRVRQINHLAKQGYRGEQIASELGISFGHLRNLAQTHDIELPDKNIRSQKINVHRVVEETVTGLSGYALGLQTINGELKEIAPEDAQAWAESITESMKPINRLRKQLQEIANG